MTPQTFQQQVLSQMQLFSTALATHIAEGTSTNEKINAVYKIIVTGDNCPPLPEVVRRHEVWIAEHDQERLENGKSRKEQSVLNAANTRDDRKEATAFKRQIWGLIIGEILLIVGMGIMFALGWK